MRAIVEGDTKIKKGRPRCISLEAEIILSDWVRESKIPAWIKTKGELRKRAVHIQILLNSLKGLVKPVPYPSIPWVYRFISRHSLSNQLPIGVQSSACVPLSCYTRWFNDLERLSK